MVGKSAAESVLPGAGRGEVLQKKGRKMGNPGVAVTDGTLVNQKILNRKPTKRLDKERVGVILQRCASSIVENWLERAKQSSDLA
jgi:hypothetical protein